MIRITSNDDIAFNVNDIRGKGDRYNIVFYTVDVNTNITKSDRDVVNGYISLNGSDLVNLGQGVMNIKVCNIEENSGYNDGVYNSAFTRTTKYYIVSTIVTPDDGSGGGGVGIEVIDNLNNLSPNKVLSARQGNVLKTAIEQMRDSLANYTFSGSKPEFSWENVTPEPVTVHTVTWTLYGLTMQGSTSVEDGETWTGTITANNGYMLPSELDSVEGDYGVLTYENGVVTLTNVTSNITIVASGIETASLTSPENGATFNIGNLGMNETTVSKMLLVKGSNVTKPVSISVSGEGITVSTNTLTPAQVNAGTNITLTYTNNLEINANVTGSLTISSDEVSATIAVTASKSVIITYSITNELTNVTNSNTDTSVAENSSYSATLSPSLSAHILDDDNITVTMGNTDVTEDVYSDGVITIEEVTGDVVITASAITYVSNGLVMHLDYNTIDLVNNKWTSLAETTDANDEPLTYEFDLTDVTVDNGAVFNGTTSKAVTTDVLSVPRTEGTIEFVVNPKSTMTNGDAILFNGTDSYGIGAATWNYGGNQCICRSINESGSGLVYQNDLAVTSTQLAAQYSLSDTYQAINGVSGTINTISNLRFIYKTAQKGLMTIGYRIIGETSAPSEKFASLTVKSIRVYNRQLTAEEAAHNYKIDKKLFNLS